MAKLSEDQLTQALGELDGWSYRDGEIVKQYQFTDFVAAMAFVNRIAGFAEAAQHHPDIDIRYNKVRLALVTHDEGGVTEKDVDLARQAEAAS